MEELAEGLLRALLRPIGFLIRALVWLIWELCFEIIAWYVGWPICRLVTLGSMPGDSIHDYEKASPFTAFSGSVVGVVSLVASGSAVAMLVGSG